MSELPPLQARRDSLSDLVYEAIRSAIIERRLVPGEPVSEARLAESLQVSKTPVREALLRLAQIGLIIPDSTRGGRVPEPSEQTLQAAYEFREGVEAQSARLAAQSASATDIDRISEHVQACLTSAHANDLAGFRLHDRQFHLAIADAAHNEYVAKSVLDAYDLVWTLRLRDSPDPGTSVSCAEQHEAILHAVTKHEVEKAGQMMRKHIESVRSAVLNVMADAG